MKSLMTFGLAGLIAAATGVAGLRTAEAANAVVVDGTVYHHYYRHHGAHHWERYYRPPAPPVPVRPLSCGEFRFWDGHACVDIRQSSTTARTARSRAVRR